MISSDFQERTTEDGKRYIDIEVYFADHEIENYEATSEENQEEAGTEPTAQENPVVNEPSQTEQTPQPQSKGKEKERSPTPPTQQAESSGSAQPERTPTPETQQQQPPQTPEGSRPKQEQPRAPKKERPKKPEPPKESSHPTTKAEGDENSSDDDLPCYQKVHHYHSKRASDFTLPTGAYCQEQPCSNRNFTRDPSRCTPDNRQNVLKHFSLDFECNKKDSHYYHTKQNRDKRVARGGKRGHNCIIQPCPQRYSRTPKAFGHETHQRCTPENAALIKKGMEGYSISRTATDEKPNGNGDLGNKPPTFDGTRSKFREWLNQIRISLALNYAKYSTDELKIFYVLSHLRGEAGLWGEAWMKDTPTPSTGTKDWGTFDSFMEKLKGAYKPGNEEDTSLAKLEQLQQGNLRASEFLTTFRLEARRSGLLTSGTLDTGNDRQLVRKLKKALKKSVVRQVMMLPTKPANFKEWCTKAIEVDDQYHEMMDSITEARPTKAQIDTRLRAVVTMTKLTTKEQEELRKKGICFRCRKGKHLAKDCTVNSTIPGFQKKDAPKKEYPQKNAKTWGKEAAIQVLTLMEGMDQDQYDEFVTHMNTSRNNATDSQNDTDNVDF
ncbi:hypothetical protein EST38_g10935 [Candolleomyces aberdarensis]|uniref:Ty3 transposon capsid-like protein domain-containing protein n=1 Tax=Candolleomyces aberdarensis TaxID=2316362 RepID=A0A4Q2D9G1_9AGAR|nr:hypothetical protein EST38_g10935 [Candolleomyces aberdarensis]